MKHCGKGVYIRPMSSDFKELWNLSVGDGTSIPKGSTIYCTDVPCTIGKKVLFGPNPTIITSDHRIDILGKYIADVTMEDKLPIALYRYHAITANGTACIAANGSKISVLLFNLQR